MKSQFRVLVSLYHLMVAISSAFCLMCTVLVFMSEKISTDVPDYFLAVLVTLMFGGMLFRYLRTCNSNLHLAIKLAVICSAIGFLAGLLPATEDSNYVQAFFVALVLFSMFVGMFPIVNFFFKKVFLKILLWQLECPEEKLNQSRVYRYLKSS